MALPWRGLGQSRVAPGWAMARRHRSKAREKAMATGPGTSSVRPIHMRC